jgi:opacity protein-like surface antigen
LFARVGLNYRWTDKLQTSVYYAFEDIDSDVTDSYSRNTLGARVRYEF